MVVLIDNEIAKKVLDRRETIDSIETAFRQLGGGNATFLSRTDIVSPTTMGDYFAWGSMVGATINPPRLALRFKSDVIKYVDKGGYFAEEKFNESPGKFMGVILLFDTRNGELLSIMNDGVIQHERVGATAAVACKYLSNEDSNILGIIGSGGMAQSYAMNISEVREIEEIKVYSPT
ncbi:MAG TPA: ornithine cyclodeaminase family protein, partial [Halobacteriales archaeon]|nr:ornithine cyclodeaminase family protein [Halobacteriales archaeon]